MRALRIALPVLVLLAVRPAPAHPESVWEAVADEPAVYDLDLEALKHSLEGVASEFDNPADLPPVVVAMPMPDGTLARFAVYESPIMEPELAARYPEIRTYGGRGLDDPTAVIRFDVSPRGLRGIILGEGGTAFVRPRPGTSGPEYGSYTREEDELSKTARCELGAPASMSESSSDSSIEVSAGISNGQTLRIYKLAAAATGEFTQQTGMGGNPGTRATALGGVEQR